jgi:hypothetical protein
MLYQLSYTRWDPRFSSWAATVLPLSYACLDTTMLLEMTTPRQLLITERPAGNGRDPNYTPVGSGHGGLRPCAKSTIQEIAFTRQLVYLVIKKRAHRSGLTLGIIHYLMLHLRECLTGLE